MQATFQAVAHKGEWAEGRESVLLKCSWTWGNRALVLSTIHRFGERETEQQYPNELHFAEDKQSVRTLGMGMTAQHERASHSARLPRGSYVK